jgi:hypothetical protein
VDLKYSEIHLSRIMLVKSTAYIPLLENFGVKNWWQDSMGIFVICRGLKSLLWATPMIIEFSLYSACRKRQVWTTSGLFK